MNRERDDRLRVRRDSHFNVLWKNECLRERLVAATGGRDCWPRRRRRLASLLIVCRRRANFAHQLATANVARNTLERLLDADGNKNEFCRCGRCR